MLSKNEYKLITSLTQKKYRQKEGLFIAEGAKLVNEILVSDFEIYKIYATDEFKTNIDASLLSYISQIELKKISQQVSPSEVLGVFKIPNKRSTQSKGVNLVLDGIQDPGNLGTIIRLCDWFGISKLICSEDTVDCFNTKVVQASMGSITRVEIIYTDLLEFLSVTNLPVFYTLLEGKNVYTTTFPSECIFVMGNEANGIRKELKKLPFEPITIPRFGLESNVESLNVAMATAVFLSELKRGSQK